MTSSVHSCDHACALTCPPDACAIHAAVPPIDFNETLARFQREATRGVCNTGRYRMPYFVWGSGPPLVVIHGLSDTSTSFVQPVWRLSTHFRCIAYDLPGTVRGDGACPRRLTHDDLIRDLFALLDHLQLDRAYLLASSLGATIALKALHERPQRLPRAILQGAFAHLRLRRTERVLAWIGRLLPGTMGGLPLRERMLTKRNRREFASRSPDVMRYFLDRTGRVPVATVGHQARLLDGLDLRPLLPAISQPVLLICGDRDRVVPNVHSDVLMNGLPNAGRIIIEQCGHLPAYTHPEVFAEVVRQFLTPPIPVREAASCRTES
jgi:pimeloyl-ACP methyl ester carboxylesterase